jgi:hypothetical protein
MANTKWVFPDDDDPIFGAGFVVSFPIQPKRAAEDDSPDLREQYEQRDEDDPTFVSPRRPKRKADGEVEEAERS